MIPVITAYTLPCAGKPLMQASDGGIRCRLLCRPTAEFMTSQCTASAAAMQTCNRHLLAVDLHKLLSKLFSKDVWSRKPKLGMLSDAQAPVYVHIELSL